MLDEGVQGSGLRYAVRIQSEKRVGGVEKRIGARKQKSEGRKQRRWETTVVVARLKMDVRAIDVTV